MGRMGFVFWHLMYSFCIPKNIADSDKKSERGIPEVQCVESTCNRNDKEIADKVQHHWNYEISASAIANADNHGEGHFV